MQKLLSEVLSFTLLPEQIVDLRKEFEKMDSDGAGEISLSGLKRVLLQNAEAGALGALTEEEVEDIFDSIRVRKSEPTIRWHEFLAAGLSQARVDDRNLRLCFERLDTERKGCESAMKAQFRCALRSLLTLFSPVAVSLRSKTCQKCSATVRSTRRSKRSGWKVWRSAKPI